jgi:Carboxypeptidase regulatory-like domain
MTFKSCIIFLIAFCSLLAAAALGQTSSTSLQGTVTDPSSSAIPGALVTLTNEAKLERTTTTDAQGGYRLLALPPGTYTLAVSAKGFARYQQTNLELLVNTPATANIQLKVGAVSEVVNVSGQAPALNLVDASIGNPFTETQIKQEPLDGRNVPELLSLQAGVAYTGNREDLLDPKVKDQDSRNGAVNGARSDQSNITLDGVDVNDQNNGYAFTSVLPVTLDSVQEFRVTTSNYNADQGEGSGAQVALVTKSGTNNFHGSLYEYHRNTITSANDYFVKNAETLTGAPNTPDKLLRNVFGASVGGPLKKDRAFFFVNYEGTRRREQDSTVRTIPSPAMRDGVLQYQCALVNNQLDAVNCPGNTVQGISNASYTSQPGFFVMGPNDITNLDATAYATAQVTPATPIGPNPYMIQYFGKTYAGLRGNDFSVGDRFNYVGFRFRAPVSFDNNVFIARLDYHLTADGKHTIFWRGALQNIFNPQEPFLPGDAPMQTMEDHSKGSVIGYTALLKPTVVNSFHWGFTRQSTGFVGNSTQEWNVFYGLDQSFAYSHNSQTPTHNINDDISWTKGQHTIQAGANLGWIRDPRYSLQHSFNEGKGATNWMSPTGFANTGSYLDPATGTNPATGNAYPEPQSAFQYDYPMLGMLGMVSDIVGNYNYDKKGNVVNYTVDANGNPISATGQPVRRDYGLNWYEFYGQDSWRIKPNLTVTFGVRWSLFPPPWEVNGFQASPTCYPQDQVVPGLGCPAFAFNTGAEFNQMVKDMNQGIGYDAIPILGFQLSGPANNGQGWYDFQKSNFSPRISVAYSPHAQSGWLRKLFGEGESTVLRGGFSKVYDRPGMQLLSTFDANPPGGLGQTIQNFCCTFGYDDAVHAPRITNINVIPHCGPADCADPNNPDPSQQLFLQPAPAALHPPSGIQAITWGIDQSLKTPYAYAFDFSIGRELPKKMSLQLAYVGRLGRNLLTQRDLRQPLDLVDNTNGPGRGMDYYQAATALAKAARAQQAAGGIDATKITNQMIGRTVAYWQDMLPGSTGGGYRDTFIPGDNFSCANNPSCLIQAVYDIYYNPGAASYPGNEVVGLGNIDLYGALGDLSGNTLHFNHPDGTPGVAGEMLNEQATSTVAWSSIGNSNYNALQATLRKQFGSSVQFDLNYTYSKSIDITSSATRLGWQSCCNVGAPGTRLVNAFDPNARRAVSDFDLTHQINANWIVELPFGSGRHFASSSSRLKDAFIGGWQLSGLTRWTSGFPFTVDNGNFWPTNWDEQGIANMVTRPKLGRFRDPVSGNVSVFANPLTAFNDFQHPFPGQSGSRNLVRGDGYAGLDMALAKRWTLPREGQSLQFRWEVFNVPNLHRFNVESGLGTSACTCIASLQQLPGSFGDYTGLLTQPREMQFALRFEF